MAKIYNLRNNKQNTKTQATQPVSLSFNNRLAIDLATKIANKIVTQKPVASVQVTEPGTPAKPGGTSILNNKNVVSAIASFGIANSPETQFYYNQQQKKKAQEPQPKTNPNFEPQLEEGKWYYSVVDNTNVQSGTRATDYGFLTSHCRDAQNGELILVNNKGEVQLIEQTVNSEDYRAQIDEVKAQYAEARKSYDTYMGAQKLALQGAENLESSYEDTHQVNSVLDAIVNTVYDYADNYSRLMAIYEGDLSGEAPDFSRTEQTWNELKARTVSGRAFMNKEIEDKYGEDWKNKFSGSYENVQAFMALEEDEMLKAYMAYQMETRDDGQSFGNFLKSILTNVGEIGDTLSTFTKPALFALDNARYEWLLDKLKSPELVDLFLFQTRDNDTMLPTMDKDHKYVGESYWDMVAAGFAPTWSETGRRTYDINSYDNLTNIVFEVASDPEFLLTMGSSALATAADDVVRKAVVRAGDDAAKLSSRALNNTLRTGVREGLSNAEIATRIASRINPDNVEQLSKVITRALDYSHAYKMAHSLHGASEVVDKTEKALMMTVFGPAYATVKGTVAGVKWIKNTDTVKLMRATQLTEKVIKDAFVETVAQNGGKYGMHNAEEFLETLDKNILGLNIAENEEVLRNLNKKTRRRVVRDTNNDMCNKLDRVLVDNMGSKARIEDELSVILKDLSDGKYSTLQEYIDDVTRIMKDNDLYDDAIVNRLNKTKELYNRAITERVRNNWAELMDAFRKSRNQYFETLRAVEYAKPDYQSFAKYADYIKDNPAPILTYQEFCKIAGFTDSIQTLDKYIPPVDPNSFMKYADFVAYMKAQPDTPVDINYFVAYNKYKDELYAQNKQAYKEYLKTKKAVAKQNQSVRMKAAEAYKKYRQGAQSRVWEDYQKFNEAINAHNQELRVAAWESYASELDAKMRGIIDEFTNYAGLFTDSDVDQKALAHIEELLSKERLDKAEWREVYDTLNATVHRRRVDAYMGMHIGTAQLPYVEVVTKDAITSSNLISNFARELKNSNFVRSIKSFGSMSEVQGKLYQAKLNKINIASAFLSDPQISRTYNDIIARGEFGSAVFDFLSTTENKGKLYYAAKELVDDAYSAKRYQSVMHFIDNSGDILEELKPNLKDKLFTLDSKLRYTFDDIGDVITDEASRVPELSIDLIEARARRTAREWIDSALAHKVKSSNAFSSNYSTLHCNDADTLLNVRNIEQQFYKVCDLKDEKLMPVFYSMNFYGESGGLVELSMRLSDGTEYTVKGAPREGRLAQQAVYAQIANILDEIQIKAGTEGKNVKFVGFNNHATGFNLDGRFSKQVYHAGATVKLYDTLDVAEQMRIAEGLTVVPEATYKELEDLLSAEFSQWYADCLATQQNLTLTLVPRVMEASQMTSFMKDVGKYSEPTAYAISTHMRTLGAHIKTQSHQIKKAHAILADGGLLYAQHGQNIIPLLAELPGNKDMLITAKLIFDDRVISRYFDIAVSDGERASQLFEFAQNCDNTLSRIMQYNILDMFAPEIKAAYDNLTQFPATKAFLDANGIALKPSTELTGVAEQYAVLHQVFHDMRYTDLDQLNTLAGNEDVAKLIYEAQTLVFRYGKEYNVFENLHGSVVRDTSMLHSSNTVLRDVEKIKQSLNKSIPMIEAQEQSLRAAGLTGSLEYVIVQHKAKLSRKLTDYVNNMYTAIEAYNAAAYTQFSLLEGNKSTILQARPEMLAQSSFFTQFKDAFFEFSKQHDVHRLQHVASQTPENFLGHLIKDCNGRMIIDKQSCDINTINYLLENVKDIPRVKFDETDDHIRIWYSAKGLTHEELDSIIEQYSTFSLDPITDTLYRAHLDSEDLNSIFAELADENAKMLLDLTEYGPNNITYGMFTINTPDLMHKLDSAFCSDIADDFLDFSTLNAMGNYKGQVACMYHGDIAKLSSEELFLSNNQFTNICNMYGRVINSMDCTNDLVRTVFNENNSFATAVESFKTLDGVTGQKGVADALHKNGYVAVALTGDKKGRLRLHQLDVSDSRVYKTALKSKYTTIMRYDTFRELEKQITYKNLALGAGKATNKAAEYWQNTLMFYHTKIRYPFIESYLFMKPSTWIRNIFDSTTKAMLKEGPEYLQYIPEAVKTFDAYTEIENAIYTTFKKTDSISIKKFFAANPDCPMTMDMFVMLKSYFNNPLSGTQLEETLKAFNLDPTVIFRRYTNLGLAEQEYKHIIDVYKKFDDVEVPMHRRMSQINAELSKLYDKQTASTLTQIYERYAGYASKVDEGSFLDKNKYLGKWLKFNMDRFNDVERINRLAIFLKRMEAGDNMGQALLAIGETQFDYTKSGFMRAVETVAPFSTFKFYNYQFWLDSVWNYNVVEYLGDAAKMLLPEEEDKEDYWSDESMSYRAMMTAFFDTLEDDDDVYDQSYASIHNYRGADAMNALEQGWIKVGDKLYLKAGNSAIDALGVPYILGNPSKFTEEAESMLFAPIQNFMKLVGDIKDFKLKTGAHRDYTEDFEKVIKQLHLKNEQTEKWLMGELRKINPDDTEALKDTLIIAYVQDHAYELTGMFPVVGTLYYSVFSALRNSEYEKERDNLLGSGILTTIMPSLFAPTQEPTTYDKYAQSYYAKPVGFDWYNQSEAYRETHRYIMGVSYVPAWVNKDPATYIDTWGRMQQLGIPKEALPELFENGKSWWFTKDDYGTYKLHNYQLIIKDETAYTEIYNTLLKYGWTAQEAEQLMAEVAIPPWNSSTYSAKDNLAIQGYGKYSGASSSQVLNSVLMNSKAAVNTAKYNMGRYSGSGKWSQYDTMPDTHRKVVHQVKGHDPSRLSKKYQKAYRWHRRTRDIYRDNYAKYGASRMAMEQNLRAYSNRSITEMRRTNMNIRYARIHNRWWAS